MSVEQPELRTIGDVVDLLQREHPSITASSLRFLERIGLVTPARTAGGHRLYAPGDIARIRAIKRLQDARLTLDEIASRLESVPHGPAIDRDELFALAVAGDAPGAIRLITSAIEQGLTVDALFGELLAPLMVDVGDRWETGEITVAQEKAASEVIRDIVAIAGAAGLPEPGAGAVLVAAAVSGERHVIGLQIVSTLLRGRGHAVHFLGADVDDRFLVDAVRRTGPDVVLLSATMSERLEAVASAIGALQTLDQAPAVVVGGQITRRHAAELAGLGALVVSEQATGPALSGALSLLESHSACVD